MTDYEAQVLSDLHVLKSQMDQLMGIGQPGRLGQLEARVTSNERTVQKTQGVLAAFATVLTLAHLAITYFGAHRP